MKFSSYQWFIHKHFFLHIELCMSVLIFERKKIWITLRWCYEKNCKVYETYTSFNIYIWVYSIFYIRAWTKNSKICKILFIKFYILYWPVLNTFITSRPKNFFLVLHLKFCKILAQLLNRWLINSTDQFLCIVIRNRTATA